jgi:hypothetical protein
VPASTNSKAVKSLKSVLRGKAIEFIVWIVKEIFGFDGKKDVG